MLKESDKVMSLNFVKSLPRKHGIKRKHEQSTRNMGCCFRVFLFFRVFVIVVSQFGLLHGL
jgi:hypothetical protein